MVWAEEVSRAETGSGTESLRDQAQSRGTGRKRPERLEPAHPGAGATQWFGRVRAGGRVGLPTVPGGVTRGPG